jgi:hypothetical protein
MHVEELDGAVWMECLLGELVNWISSYWIMGVMSKFNAFI